MQALKERRANEEAIRIAAAEERARRIAAIEATQQPKDRRRMESFARLLESPTNVCVALVKADGQWYSASNEGDISRVSYIKAELFVERLDKSTGRGEGERTRARDARKVAAYVGDGMLTAEDVEGVLQVEVGSLVHAEMKILDWLVKRNVAGTYEVFVSKLCCSYCRIALDKWNASSSNIKVNSPGDHGNYFVGWEFPACIPPNSELFKSIRTAMLELPSDTNKKNWRGRTRVVEDSKSQRELSVSPAPSTRVRQFG